MIENLIARFELENEKIDKKINELSLNNKINEAINKVLNDIELFDDEIEILCDAIKNNLDYIDVDKETLEFILFILPTKEKLDVAQKNILKLVKNKYQIIDVSTLQRKKKRNAKFIELLASKEVFIYLDELSETLKEYNYDLKNILIIIRLLVKNNFKVQLETKKEDDNSNDELVSKESVQSELEPVELIVKEDLDDDIVNSEESLVSFFRKNKLYYNKLQYEAKELLKKSPIDFEDADKIFSLLEKNGFKIKSLYSEHPNIVVSIILFSDYDSINEVIKICSLKRINLKSLFNAIPVIFIPNSMGGRMDDFIHNMQFFDEKDIEIIRKDLYSLYVYNNYKLINIYKIFDEYYNIKITNDFMLGCMGCSQSITSLDRLIESFDRLNLDLLKLKPDLLMSISQDTAYNYKKFFNIKRNDDSFNNTNNISLVISYLLNNNYEKYESELELDEYSEYLYSLFEKKEDNENQPYYFIPSNIFINDNLFENEFVKELDEKYKVNNLFYMIHGTKVSRVKFLRVLSSLMLNGIDIREEEVKFALKFNYVFVSEDYRNIDRLFGQKRI